MGLTQIIKQHEGRLTKADQRIVQAMLADTVSASFWSASELAQRAEVHEASVVRLAQKLGFAGYPELRATLQEEVISHAKPAERVRRRLTQAVDVSLLNNLIRDEIAALQELARMLTQEQLDTAAQLLIGARTIAIFGSGHANTLVELMDRRLRRSGYRPIVLSDSPRDLVEHLLSLQAGDVILAFVFRTWSPQIETLLHYAAEHSIRVVLISDTVGPVIRPQPQVLLAAPRGAIGDYQTLTVPMAICNALVLTLARLDDGSSLESLRQLEELFEQFRLKGGK
jgi:DNA-binding MurR/RpiR family transcriptional regulator